MFGLQFVVYSVLLSKSSLFVFGQKPFSGMSDFHKICVESPVQIAKEVTEL